MKLRNILFVAVAALLGVCAALGVVGSTAAQDPLNDPSKPFPPIKRPVKEIESAPAVGRYQLTVSGPILFMMDTSTGEVWQSTGKTSWQHAVNPLPKSKP